MKVLRPREEESQANLDKQKITTYNVAEIQTAITEGMEKRIREKQHKVHTSIHTVNAATTHC